MLFAGVVLGAGVRPPFRLLILVLVAGVGARTAAMGLNRVIDRHIDARNPRTAARELPSGAIGTAEAWGLIAAGTLVYLVAAWLLAPVCLALAPLPLAVFVLYPYLKRITPWCHLGVGLALAMAPLGGWFAARLTFEDVGPALLLAGFTLGWVAGFDVLYATLDEAHDRSAGIRSLPARYGRAAALRAAQALHIGAWALVATLVFWRLAWVPALLPLAALGALLGWEHLRSDDLDLAFFRINVAVGFVALAVIVAGVGGK